MADRLLSIRTVTDRDSPQKIGSRSALYKLLASGELHAVKVGRSTYILESERDRFLASLPAARFGSVKADRDRDLATPKAAPRRRKA